MKIRTRDLLYLTYGIIIFLFIGIYWWSLPYSELNMGDAFVQWSIFILAASFVFRFFIKLSTQKLVWSSIIGIAMVIVVRFIHDISIDNTTHNLVAVEVIIAVIIGAAGSIAGVFLANLFQPTPPNDNNRSKTEIENTKKENRNFSNQKEGGNG